MKEHYYVLKGPMFVDQPTFLSMDGPMQRYILDPDVRHAKFFDSEQQAEEFIDMFLTTRDQSWSRNALSTSINLNALAIHKATIEVEE